MMWVAGYVVTLLVLVVATFVMGYVLGHQRGASEEMNWWMEHYDDERVHEHHLHH